MPPLDSKGATDHSWSHRHPLAINIATSLCRQSFEDCLTISQLMHNEWAENRLADFNLWASGVGASARQRASLDQRLTLEPEVKSIVVNLLKTLNGFIRQCIELGSTTNTRVEDEPLPAAIAQASLPLPPEDPIPRSFSPWSDDSSSSIESAKAVNDLSKLPAAEAMRNAEAILDRLVKLGVAIRRSGTSSRLQKADRNFDPRQHENFRNYLALILLGRPSDVECSRHEFWDTLDENRSVNFGIDIAQLTPVQRRLIDANLRRRNRFIYAQSHARKLATLQAGPIDIAELAEEDNDELYNDPRPSVEAVSSISTADPLANSKRKGRHDVAGMTDTTASAIGTTIKVDMPKPSTPSQVAVTIASSTGAKLRDDTYPNPPKVKEGLSSFTCPCCCQVFPLMFAERQRWRKHIVEDLCPYTCPLEACSQSESLYITRDAWMEHVQNDHRSPQYWECLACGVKERFFGVDIFTSHIREVHPDGISEANIPALIEACSAKEIPKIYSCPLCDETGNGLSADENTLLDHVIKHVHSFSLKSLPWATVLVQDHSHWSLSVEKVKEWLQPTPDEIEGYLHVSEYPHISPDVDSHFFQNDYFAEESGCSSLAQMDSHASTTISEEAQSLKYISSQDSESDAESDSDFEQGAANSLRGRLIQARISSFVPICDMEEIFTDVAVAQEMQSLNPNLLQEEAMGMAQKICQCSKRLFAVLLYIKRDRDIWPMLKDGILDKDLPLARVHGRLNVKTSAGHRSISAMGDWSLRDHKNFDRVQYWMLAPFFQLRQHYILADGIPLPFINIPATQESPWRKQGGYAEVFPVRIHPAHHDFWVTGPEEQEPLVAVKMLFSANEREFQKEATILKALGSRSTPHPHLVNLLATYFRNDRYHLMFPFANSNLRKFWEDREVPAFDDKTVLWFMRQITGISNALNHIHNFKLSILLDAPEHVEPLAPEGAKLWVRRGEELFGRHGDIKPENILWFEDSSYGEGGVLKLTDIGTGRFHGRDARLKLAPEYFSLSTTYEPPECKLHHPASRAYDMWSLGCVYLEFITWLLKGTNGIEDFSALRRRNDPRSGMGDYCFYTFHVDDATVRDLGRSITTARKVLSTRP